MVDRDRIVEWLRAIDLSRLACTAALDDQGNLSPVGGLWPKLSAAAEEMARMGLLGIVATAAKQDDVPEALTKKDASPLRVLQGQNLEELLERLYEEDGPRAEVRKYERDACGKLELLDRKVAIEDHYQPLPLLREVKKEDLPHVRPKSPRESSEATEPDHRGFDLQRWEEEVLGKLVTYKTHGLEEVFANFRLVVKDARTNVPRFVVVGPPGSGKSTLVQKLARQAAAPNEVEGWRCNGRRLLPARVRLRDWEAWVVKPSNPETSLADYLAYLTKDYPAPTPTTEQWRRWLKRGEVLLLFDGLDEIDGKDLAFKAALEAALRLFPSCPTVMTCRTVSFEQHQATCHDLPVFVLAGLDDGQRDRYIRTYSANHPEKFDPVALVAQLKRMPAMRPLATNPLLLSILCFVVDDPGPQKVDLPATRGELYDRAVARLLERPPRVPVSFPSTAPDTEGKRSILERAALELFAGNDRRSLTFSGMELGRALKAALREQGYGDAPTPWANALREDLTQNSGLLRGDSKQGYFYLHPTFQEFLAASCLVRVVNEGGGWEVQIGLDGKTRTVREWVDKKAWDPRWQEVICLLAGRLDDTRPLLKMLSNPKRTATNAAGDDVFRHRLALGASCLDEIPSAIRDKQAPWIDRITTTVFGLCWKSSVSDTTAAYGHMTRTLPCLGRVNGRVPAVGDPGTWVTAETPLSAKSPYAIALLNRIAELLEERNKERRCAATKIVGDLGLSAATEPILDRLADLLRDKNRDVRDASVKTVGRLCTAAATPLFLRRLADLLRDKNGDVRFASVWSVGCIGPAAATEPILDRLLLQDEDVGGAVGWAVGRLGPAAATPALLDRLGDLLGDGHWGVRSAAAEAVGKLGSEAGFLDRLAHRLRDAEAVGKLSPAVEYLDRLADLLRDDGRSVRRAAAEAVGRLGPAAATKPILDRLAFLLQDEDLRGVAAEAVGRMGPAAATEPILDRLGDLLRDENEDVWLANAAEAVGRMGPGAATEPILDRLADLLRDKYVRRAAAPAVGELMGEGLRFFQRTLGPRPRLSRKRPSGWEARTVSDLSR